MKCGTTLEQCLNGMMSVVVIFKEREKFTFFMMSPLARCCGPVAVCLSVGRLSAAAAAAARA